MENVVNAVVSVFMFLLVINFLVAIHEFGHLVASKLSGLAVKEFAIGFGKILTSRVIGGTKYSIRAIPLGGYVEPEGETERDLPNSFRGKKLRVKAFVLLAGVFMNIITAIVFFGLFLPTKEYVIALPPLVDYQFSNTVGQIKAAPLFVTNVIENGNSAGQIFPKDVIVAINGTYFKTYNEFITKVKENQGKEVKMTFLNMDDFKQSERTIKIGLQDDKGIVLGVSFADTEHVQEALLVKYQPNIISSFAMTGDMAGFEIKALGSLISKAFATGDFKELGESVGSPVQILNQSSQIVAIGDLTFFLFLGGFLSLSLAIFNILPLPALDGGQLFFYVIEKVTGRQIPDKVLNAINLGGFIFLMGLGLLVMFKDVIQLNVFGRIEEFVRQILGR